MALQLCVISDVADWWSTDGIVARLDDDRSDGNDSGETAVLTRIIERASALVAAKLGQRYNQEAFGGSNPPTNTPVLVMHFTAVLASYYLGVRRNLPIPKSLENEYERVIKTLDEILANRESLPGVAESFDTTPFLTNYHIDGRYRSTRFRRIEATSVGNAAAPPIKTNPETFRNFGPFE